MTPEFPIHVRTLFGLENILAQELTALGAKDISTENRVVICRGNLELLYRANIFCRTAMRVLLPISSFESGNEKAFYQGMCKIDWTQWLSHRDTFMVDAHINSSFSTHSLYIAQLSKDAIVDVIREKEGERPSVDLEFPKLRVVAQVFQDKTTVFIDSSGVPLHKRGYRRKVGEAPLNEVLAAGMVLQSGWDSSKPLLNPMCGSGTIAIEAGLIAKNFAPGLLRNDYDFKQWRSFDKPLYEKLMNEARAAVRGDVEVSITGVDSDDEAIQAARENIERANLSKEVRVEKEDFFALDPTLNGAGILLMNPPYDERLPVDNIAELYEKTGDLLKKKYGGWTAYLLSGNLEALKYVGLRSQERTILYNGAIECRLAKYEMRSGEVSLPAWRAKTISVDPRWQEKAQVLANRLQKNFRHLSKWARREGISAWRVYDRDIPELPFIIDLFGDRLHFAEIQRNHDHSPIEHARYMELMVETAQHTLGIDAKHTYFKKRKPQKPGGFQYGNHADSNDFFEVTEGGHKFLVNLADYLDVGLFLDHRKTRSMVEKESQGKDFLNLFAYTGSFSIYSAAGDAKSTVTVDSSRTYLEWAEKNLELNGFQGPRHRFIRANVFDFLSETDLRFDLCVVDPPTRSVNRSSERVFEIQKDHVELLRRVSNRMRIGGVIFFSTNYRTFVLNEEAVSEGRNLKISEITSQTMPPDFKGHPPHRCWKIEILSEPRGILVRT